MINLFEKKSFEKIYENFKTFTSENKNLWMCFENNIEDNKI